MITAALSFAALFVVVLTSAIKKQKQLVCSSIQVKIDYDSGLAFLTENELKDRVNFLTGGAITGKPLSGIDFRNIEKDIRKNPFVGDAQIYADQSQKVVLEVLQKRPILRVINNDGVSYYISEKNERIPLSDNFTAHVPIALGNVEMHRDTKRDSAVQAALYKLTLFVKKDEFLNALVDQLYVEEDGDVTVVPKIGGHTIRFGAAGENIAEKFDKLKVFYNEGLRKTGWTKYKTIDLRYKDQVVCEKRDTTNKQ
jgi:cell division protein FtsQ